MLLGGPTPTPFDYSYQYTLTITQIYSIYHLPGNVLSLFHVLTHVTITMTPWNKGMFFSPSYSWWEQVTERLSNLPSSQPQQECGSAPSQPHSPALPARRKKAPPCCPAEAEPNTDCRWLKGQIERVSTTYSALQRVVYNSDVISTSVYVVKNSCHGTILMNGDCVAFHFFTVSLFFLPLPTVSFLLSSFWR